MPRLKHIRLPPGTMLTERYRIEERLGAGWEGEVYKVVERRTGIARAAKKAGVPVAILLRNGQKARSQGPRVAVDRSRRLEPEEVEQQDVSPSYP